MTGFNQKTTANSVHTDVDQPAASSKLRYGRPSLTVFGSVVDLTKGTLGSGADGGNVGSRRGVQPSDPALKENVVRVGDHPAGVGLYLFDYKDEFRDSCGHGRQFGLMADEVEKIMPEAVSLGVNGFRQVNYGMMGIIRH